MIHIITLPRARGLHATWPRAGETNLKLRKGLMETVNAFAGTEAEEIAKLSAYAARCDARMHFSHGPPCDVCKPLCVT